MSRALGLCLVTGAGGFIGRRLVAALRARGETVLAWTRAVVDLTDASSVAAAMRADPPDTIFHLAAVGVDAARAHDEAQSGAEVAMVDNLVAASREGARFIFAGSMAEYGASGRLREDQACHPRTAYARAKHAAGQHLLSRGPASRVEVCATRIFGAYGPGEAAARLFPSLILGLSRGSPVALSDGTQWRDFIHVDDTCSVLMALAQAPRMEPIVNVGTGQSVRVADVARWIASGLGADHALLQFGARPRSPGDEDRLEADTSVLQQLAGAPPQRLQPGLDVGTLFGVEAGG